MKNLKKNFLFLTVNCGMLVNTQWLLSIESFTLYKSKSMELIITEKLDMGNDYGSNIFLPHQQTDIKISTLKESLNNINIEQEEVNSVAKPSISILKQSIPLQLQIRPKILKKSKKKLCKKAIQLSLFNNKEESKTNSTTESLEQLSLSDNQKELSSTAVVNNSVLKTKTSLSLKNMISLLNEDLLENQGDTKSMIASAFENYKKEITRLKEQRFYDLLNKLQHRILAIEKKKLNDSNPITFIQMLKNTDSNMIESDNDEKILNTIVNQYLDIGNKQCDIKNLFLQLIDKEFEEKEKLMDIDLNLTDPSQTKITSYFPEIINIDRENFLLNLKIEKTTNQLKIMNQLKIFKSMEKDLSEKIYQLKHDKNKEESILLLEKHIINQKNIQKKIQELQLQIENNN